MKNSRSTLLAGAALVLAALAAYHNSFDAPFLFDDTPAIIDNQTIRHLWPPGEALSPPADGAGVTGRPLVNLSLAVNYALGGLQVRGYHAMNLALHMLAALTLWGVLRRTLVLLSDGSELAREDRNREQARSHNKSDPRRLLQEDAELIAFVMALLWTVHPLLTESVVCVVQRNEVMGGLFYLLTLYCFIRGVEVGRVSDPPARPVKDRSYSTWFAVSVASCLLGMASKEIVATAPLLVLLYDRTFVAGAFRAAWQRRKLFYGALAATWLLLAWLMFHTGQREGTVGFGLGVSSWDYLLTQCRALVIYLKLSFWPHPLVVDYGMGVVKNMGEVWRQGLLVVALLLGTVAALWRRPVMGFPGAWFFVILAPSSSFVPLTTQTIAEHRMYLPLIAVVVLAVAGLHALAGRRAVAVCVALAAGLGAVTVRRNAEYLDEPTLWAGTIAQQPANPRAHAILGGLLAKRGRTAEAIAHYEQALRIEPRYADAHNNLGTALLAEGRTAEAVAHFEQALQIQPDNIGARNNLGNALMNAGRTAEAIAHFEQALRLKPGDGATHNNLGAALMAAGRTAEGLAHFEQASRSGPANFEAELNLGLALAAAGEAAGAIPHFERAVQLQPGDAEAHNGLGTALMSVGRAAEGLAHFEQALRFRPDYAEAERNLGLALVTAGRTAEAIPHFERAVQLKPDYAEAEMHWAIALAVTNRVPESVAHFEKALALAPGSADAHLGFSRALRQLGRTEEAAQHHHEALRLNPGLARGNSELQH